MEGLNIKVKVELCEIFGKEVEVKRYLLWVSDVGTINFVKFRSETHGLNEELGI